MLNRDGIRKKTYGAPRQILADVNNQSSVGCIVPQSMGVDVNGRKIAKAGTPVKLDFMNLQTAVVPADATTAANAVLLHDVDVTDGNSNGTALIFGFVNVNRVDTDVATAITAAMGADGITPLVTFCKM